MDAMKWKEDKDGLLSFYTGAGFRLLRGRCAFKTDGGLFLAGKSVTPQLSHKLHQKKLHEGATEFSHTLRNDGALDLSIQKSVLFDGWLDLESPGWKALHPELYKCDRYFDGSTQFTGGLTASPEELRGPYGMSEDLPFPGIFFFHPSGGTVLMAVLSQVRCKPTWVFKRDNKGINIIIEEKWTGAPAIHLPSGEEFSTERWLILRTGGGVEEAIDMYYGFLRERYSFFGSRSILREAALWGSWNYNVRPRGYGDITHDYIVKNAEALRKIAGKRPAFVMIDDGYQRGGARRRTCSLEGLSFFYPDPAGAHDPELFPFGMQCTASAIMQRGVLPAIWSTPTIKTASALARERPDLLLRLEGERSFISGTGHLDYSIPEAREYTRACWHVIFNEWGYKGIKLDFWTYPFEIPQARFRNNAVTGIELRNLFLSDLRDFVPQDGYILTACCTNTGNPFIGLYADAARISVDIGAGGWCEILRAAEWATVAALFFRGDALLADTDSFGWSPAVSRRENEAWATLALISGSAFEIGGDLMSLPGEASNMLKKGIRCMGPRGRAVSDLLRFPAGSPGGHWVAETGQGTAEAWINWSDYHRRVFLPYGLRNVWTGEKLGGEYLLPAHGAILSFES